MVNSLIILDSSSEFELLSRYFVGNQCVPFWGHCCCSALFRSFCKIGSISEFCRLVLPISEAFQENVASIHHQLDYVPWCQASQWIGNHWSPTAVPADTLYAKGFMSKAEIMQYPTWPVQYAVPARVDMLKWDVSKNVRRNDDKEDWYMQT